MRNDKGIAIFMVMWIIILLSVVAAQFCRSMRNDVIMTTQTKSKVQSRYIAEAGIYRAIGALSDPEKFGEVTDEEVKEPIETPFKWRINVDLPELVFKGAAYRLRIDNASGKINLNGANDKLLKMMLASFNLSEQDQSEIVDAIMDWRDPNSLKRLNGAENNYYASLEPPYACANGPFSTTDELLLVKGVTPEMYYGGIRELITVYPKENVIGFFSTTLGNRININAASREMLLSLPGLTGDLVDGVLAFRQEKDFESISELTRVIGQNAYKSIRSVVTLRMNDIYSINSTGYLENRESVSRVSAVVLIDRIKKKFSILNWAYGNL